MQWKIAAVDANDSSLTLTVELRTDPASDPVATKTLTLAGSCSDDEVEQRCTDLINTYRTQQAAIAANSTRASSLQGRTGDVA